MMKEKVYVWDRFTRFFHWNLVLGIIGEYLLAEWHLDEWHAYLGYYLALLIAVRILIGIFGSGYARFKHLAFAPGEALKYLFSLPQGKAKQHQAHNPASAYMIMALLFVVSVVIFSGMMVYAYIEYSGPLAFFSSYLPNDLSGFFRDFHEIAFSVLLILIVFHVLGAFLSSLIHKENLIVSMFTGFRKKI